MADVSISVLSVDLPHDYFVWVGDYQKFDWHPWFEHIDSVKELIDSGRAPQIIVLAAQGEKQDKWLEALRHNELTSQCLILVHHKSALSSFLANGQWCKEFREKYQYFKLKRQQAKLDFTDNASHKLLNYLWCHQGFVLEPQPVPEKPFLYNYPLINAWGISPKDSFSWLNHLQKNNWLEKAELKNRLRLCPSCHSGHLNYIDVCPRCHSIEIEHKSSLHCFNCGHVGAQPSFRKFNSLSCPNCLQSLRHIGVDYDRPIENHVCTSCQTLFVDPVVEAECLHCNVSNKLEDLHVRNVHSFKLSEQGVHFVRHGKSMSSFGLEPGEQMMSAQFCWLVDWQNKLAIRHKLTHVILLVQTLNVPEILNAEGEAKGFARLDALQERLRSLIRVTDACSNDTPDGLFIMLPLTKPGQLKSISKKLSDLEDLQAGSKIKLNVKAIELPAEISGDVGDWLTDQFLQAGSLRL